MLRHVGGRNRKLKQDYRVQDVEPVARFSCDDQYLLKFHGDVDMSQVSFMKTFSVTNFSTPATMF